MNLSGFTTSEIFYYMMKIKYLCKLSFSWENSKIRQACITHVRPLVGLHRFQFRKAAFTWSHGNRHGQEDPQNDSHIGQHLSKPPIFVNLPPPRKCHLVRRAPPHLPRYASVWMWTWKFSPSVVYAKPCLNLNYSSFTASSVWYPALIEHNRAYTLWYCTKICHGYPSLTPRKAPENATVCQSQQKCGVQIFTTLHGMQTQSSDENSVCQSVRPSVRLSVCHTRGCWQNGRKICPDLYTIRKNIYPSFLRRMVGGGRPLLREILGQPTPIGAKSSIFNQ